MILPTKGIPPRRALVSIGADVLRLLTEVKTVSRLWDEFKRDDARRGSVEFDWFVLSLDLLFIFGAIDLDRDRIRRSDLARPPS
jgi:hypothetical protein